MLFAETGLAFRTARALTDPFFEHIADHQNRFAYPLFPGIMQNYMPRRYGNKDADENIVQAYLIGQHFI